MMCHTPERYTANGTDDRKNTRRYRESKTMRYRKSKLTCCFVSLMYVQFITCLNALNYGISYNMMRKHGSC